ncbi:MAG TPA: M23 family metallopeptidase [Vicinamibacterales bacterium]|nr:M23 family metallopeptidase [Vicinamibacterales bacterium]
MLIALSVLLGLYATAAQTDAVALHVSHRARAMSPGEVVLVTVRPRVPVHDVEGRWFDETIRFYKETGGLWQGLAPIDLGVRAGRYTLALTAHTDEGVTLARNYTIAITARVFPVRRLTVAPDFANPPPDAIERIQREQATVESIFDTRSEERLWSAPFTVPVPGEATSSFGRRSIVNGEPRSPHSGTDFQAATGTIVRAPNRGRVVLATDLYFAGETVIVDHGDGLYSYFAHLSAIDVREGDVVNRGDRIGLSGATGRVTGPHLHWSMRFGRARVDPLSLVSVLEAEKGGAKPPSAGPKRSKK